MRLFHLTNYSGKKILPNKSVQDPDTDLNLIWVQAVHSDDKYPCCSGFDTRVINITEEVLDIGVRMNGIMESLWT